MNSKKKKVFYNLKPKAAQVMFYTKELSVFVCFSALNPALNLVLFTANFSMAACFWTSNKGEYKSQFKINDYIRFSFYK